MSFRIPGGGKTNITFGRQCYQYTSTIAIGINNRIIASLFMDENMVGDQGDWDICIQSTDLSYGNLEASSRVGSRLTNKPIGNFYTGTDYPTFLSVANQLRITVNSAIIPEPEEYPLVFGLFVPASSAAASKRNTCTCANRSLLF